MSSRAWKKLAIFSLFTVSSGLSAAPVSEPESQLFTLGTVRVTANTDATDYGDQVATHISQEQMQDFDRHTVTEALGLLSGVSTSSNARNEGLIFLRGFDSRQAPIFVDGIPVYVPYDGYVDLDRFTTGDLAAIEVAKGMSSMMYGANTLGGAINLVTRKPGAPLEGSLLVGAGSGNLQRTQANIGTAQEGWYLQAALSENAADYRRLSDDFVPGVREDGGRQTNSDFEDRKLSVKLGITPNAGDEYALGYVRQDGVKGNPVSTDPAAMARYWRWPYWDKESVYFISHTALGGTESLRIRAFKDNYGNGLLSYTDDNYTTIKTSGSGSVSATGGSYYDDESFGSSAQLQSTRWQRHLAKLQYSIKDDLHTENDGLVQEKRLEDRIESFAVEDNISLGDAWLLILGASRDTLTPKDSDIYDKPNKQSADNYQAGLYFDVDAQHRFYTSIARKSRLPTLKDRYSLRFGTFLANPDLRAEHATHYELGYQGKPWSGAKVEAAIFYSDIEDLIQRVRNVQPGLDQMQNINKARHQGFEFNVRQTLSEQLLAGIGYTYLERDNLSSDTKLIDTPRNKANLWLDWRVLARLQVFAFVDYADQRWSSDTAELEGFTTGNVKLNYQLTSQLTLATGVNNITDRNYELSDGYPEAGREYFANLRFEF